MNVFKRITLWFSKIFLHLAVAGWISAVIFVMLFGTSSPIKQALKTSRVYERLPDIVLQQSTLETDSNAKIPLDNKNFNEIIKEVFPASKLQGYSENFIDGIYNWLLGKSAEPDFRIDLSGSREKIGELLANRAIERLKTLPPCTQVPPGPIDPFTISCLPPGVDFIREKQRITNEVLANKEFLPETIFTADQLPKTPDGRTFVSAYKDAPKAFRLTIILPWLLGIVIVLSSVIIVLVSVSKRHGVRTVGRIILVNGSFVFVTTLVFGLLLPRISGSLQAHFTGDGAPLVNDVLKIVLQKIISVSLIVSGAVTALGGAILLAERFIKPKNVGGKPLEQKDVPIENTEKEKSETKPEEAKNKLN